MLKSIMMELSNLRRDVPRLLHECQQIRECNDSSKGLSKDRWAVSPSSGHCFRSLSLLSNSFRLFFGFYQCVPSFHLCLPSSFDTCIFRYHCIFFRRGTAFRWHYVFSLASTTSSCIIMSSHWHWRGTTLSSSQVVLHYFIWLCGVWLISLFRLLSAWHCCLYHLVWLCGVWCHSFFRVLWTLAMHIDLVLLVESTLLAEELSPSFLSFYRCSVLRDDLYIFSSSFRRRRLSGFSPDDLPPYLASRFP